MIHRNVGFKCLNCGKSNPKATKSCRNHCRNCLHSQHLDEETPGDRLSSCQGIMEPLNVEISGKKGYQIVHGCLKCGKIIKNMTAPDDNIDAITSLIHKQNMNGTLRKNS